MNRHADSSASAIHDVTTEEIVRANAEVQTLLRERLPRSFPVEVSWPFVATGFFARTGAILDAVTALVERGRRADAEVALRSVYEHATVFCWLGINPEANLPLWMSRSEAKWKTFYTEARKDLKVQVIPEEDAASLGSERTMPLDQLADQVDAYWPQRLPAFHKDSIRSFRGSYTAIFRPASRMAHAEVDALQPFVDIRPDELVVSTKERARFGRPVLAFPLFGLMLLVYREHFDWPEQERARRIADSLLFDAD